MIKNTTVEVCCGGIEDCKIADSFDIDRIELNSALELGGLTPSLATYLEARKCTDKPICVMVRPRPAGFLYTQSQYVSMLEDAELFLQHGADGIVFGFLNPDNTVDEEKTKAMCTLVHRYGKQAVFHKAFDLCPDLNQAVSALISCGIDRILTAGGTGCILDQLDVLESLQSTYGKQIELLPGGGVRADNIKRILAETGCTQIHMSAREKAKDNGSYDAVSSTHLSSILSHI